MTKRYKTKNAIRKLIKKNEVAKNESYICDVGDCIEWFHILNEELFNNELPQIGFDLKWLRVCWAYYEYYPRKPDKPKIIIMNKKYPSYRLFVECLAHEMIHHWQYMKLGWKKVDHGDEFVEWSKKAKRIGLRIGEEQSE